jgi:hypothetical protein
VDKVKPPYPLNEFPPDFGQKFGKEIVYLLAIKSIPDVAGPEWEQIFANCIGATWKPSNVGLDDITLGVCAWGAKSVKNRKPHQVKNIRLISGRNSPVYSYGQTTFDIDPQELGENVLSIWNARVESVRSRFSHLRMVILIKSNDLTELAVFETETVFYPVEQYTWSRNKNGNLVGFDNTKGSHCFTWQPHGSQFTIFESVPDDCLLISLKAPPKLDKNEILKAFNFDESWVSVTRRNALTNFP